MDRTPSKTRAALWMSGWLALMLIVAVAGREATREVNVFQLMAVRGVLGFVMLYPLIHINGGFAIVKTARVHIHIARNLIHFCAQLGWFYALTLIPIGQVVAIEFTMPIWTAILAASFLGERMTSWKIVAIVLGLVGVIGLGFLLIPQYGLMGAAWSRAIIQVLVILIEIICAAIQLGFSMPYRALGAIGLAAAAQGAVAYAIVLNIGGAVSLVIAAPAAVLTYLTVVRLLRVIPLVDPELPSRLVSHTPGRFRPLALRIMRLLAPPTSGRAEQD